MISGEFYGQPLAVVVRRILEKRRIANQGPATVAEIYDTMLLGDYNFETANADNAKRSLRISLTKNSSTFHKLPSGKYGLREWYPALRDRRDNGGSRRAEDDASDPEMAEADAFHEVLESDEETASNGQAPKIAR